MAAKSVQKRIAQAVAQRSRGVLAIWTLVLAVAIVAGIAVHADLHDSDLQISGTEASKAMQLSRSKFGSTVGMAVLLQGPATELNRRGPVLVRQLQQIAGVQVLSPWAPGGRRTIDGRRDRAVLLLQVSRPFEEIAKQTTPAVQSLLDRAVRPPLQSHLTGLAPLVRELNRATLDATERGELIALPVLLLLLLLVFRSPLAAALPALCGLLVTAIGTTVIEVLSGFIEVDALALNMVTMLGLALGVDYSLLMVSRFREELDRGAEPLLAAQTAAQRCGRTVLFAGAALALGMLVALLIAPGAVLVSAVTGMLVATLISVLAANTAIPAALALLGRRIDWLRVGRRGNTGSRWLAVVQSLLARPGVAALAVALPLLAIAAPAIALNTGPPNVKNLPHDDRVRKDFEAFEQELGSGWATPFEVVVAARGGQIASRAKLARLDRFQAEVADDPDVAAVFGPASVGERSRPLIDLARRLPSSFARGDRNLRRLAQGLIDANRGVGRLRAGLSAAASGAGTLAAQIAAARSGAAGAQSGIGALQQGSTAAESGANKLTGKATGLASELSATSSTVSSKVGDPVGAAQSQIQAARTALASLSPPARADPGTQQALDALAAASAQLNSAESALSGTESSLNTGAAKAAGFADGLRQLRGGLSQLSAGTNRLQGATGSLNGGLGALNGGAEQLSSGLAAGVNSSAGLPVGLNLLRGGVVRFRTRTQGAQRNLRASGTNLSRTAESGYFVLAGIEGGPRQARINSDFAINTTRGGDAGRVFVVPRTGLFDAGTSQLRDRLNRQADQLAGAGDVRAVVGGPAAVLSDFDRTTRGRLIWLVMALVLTTLVVLIAAFRAPLLAAIAVLLNLLTVAVALGILALLFQGGAVLDGPGYLDAISLFGVIGVIFGLSIDYEVFLLARIVEGRERTGSTEAALAYGLQRTAGVITGAAAIMTGVFIAFALSDVSSTRQFGVGLAVAVILDATVVRLVLLPALIKLAGDRVWWVPRLSSNSHRPTS